ncbi:phosphomethylpyrimidine synthase ThiC [Vallitalea guaymasensis]|uniref:Multifunctional fusion protein n=2 Tax=Vallitalea guaymasensis TaxID=1185412 RepID=A0A8J8MEM8_9FIRM|nr:phosphomethylpyrimidine synthase ThiC [Vallitalea guaymasensis]
MKFENELYLISKQYPDFNILLEKTEQALREGIYIFQYRSKEKNKDLLHNEAIKIKELCDKYNASLIINDRVDIAKEVGADGVHLGQDDTSIKEARDILGEDVIIGATAKTVEDAVRCYEEGADYLGVGALFPSPTKLDAVQIKLKTLIDIKNAVPIPIVGIGGITAENLSKEINENVDSIAVISEIYDSKNIKDAIKKLKDAFLKGRNTMNYTTQMDAARKGIITKEMEIVAKKENMDVNVLADKIAKGTVVIPANKNHKSIDPEGVGDGLRTKINVNLGISKDSYDIDRELEKVKVAIDMKAESIMDLSNYGKTEEFRKKLIDMSSAMIGTVPVYDALGFYDKELKDITEKEFLDVVEKHGKDGVDFVTIHAGINRETANTFRRNPRLMNLVSRGGSLMFAWMQLNKKENPFYEHYDELLDICAKYDITISLGDACRPGAIADSTDASQIKELIVLGELTKRAWAKNVQVIIEGPGHMAINEIEANMLLEKKLCHGAPFYVLGPLVTDIAPGYDHITGAIGGAVAAASGADFLCYVTPAEHLRLPSIDDMKEGIIATRIAAHAGDIGKKLPNSRAWDNSMSYARQQLDWNKMFELAMDPVKAKKYRESSKPEDENSCSMCGKMCAVRNLNKVLNGEDINILRD